MNFLARESPWPPEPPAARAAEWLKRASIEITAAEGAVDEALACGLPVGAEVFVAFLPGESVDRAIAAARRLHWAGYRATPHIVARAFATATALEACVAGFADVGIERALVTGGDHPRTAGPFDGALAALRSDVFRRRGFRRIYFALHPEGHPVIPAPMMRRALMDKIAIARDNGLEAALVSQFALDARAIAAELADLPEVARDAPLRLGFAGPTNAKTLLKYALYSGVGTTLKTLGARGAALDKLAAVATPERILAETAAALDKPDAPKVRIEGAHFYTYGGVAPTAAWIARLLSRSVTMH